MITPTELSVFAMVERFLGPDNYQEVEAVFFVTGYVFIVVFKGHAKDLIWFLTSAILILLPKKNYS